MVLGLPGSALKEAQEGITCSSSALRGYVLNRVCVKAFERRPTYRQTYARKQRLPGAAKPLPGLAVGEVQALSAGP
jgi:hypothetical protein